MMVEKVLELTGFEKAMLWASDILGAFRKVLCALLAILALCYYLTGEPTLFYIVDTRVLCLVGEMIMLAASGYHLLMSIIQDDEDLMAPALARLATAAVFTVLGQLTPVIFIEVSIVLILSSFAASIILSSVAANAVRTMAEEALKELQEGEEKAE